jgi:hypothetical protein
MMTHRRRLDDVRNGERHQGDNSGFGEINCFDFPLWFLQYAPFFQRDRFEKRVDALTRIRSASPPRHLKVMHLSRDHRLVIAEYNEKRIHHEIDNH